MTRSEHRHRSQAEVSRQRHEPPAPDSATSSPEPSPALDASHQLHLTPALVLRLQRTIGNRQVQRLLNERTIQRELTYDSASWSGKGFISSWMWASGAKETWERIKTEFDQLEEILKRISSKKMDEDQDSTLKMLETFTKKWNAEPVKFTDKEAIADFGTKLQIGNELEQEIALRKRIRIYNGKIDEYTKKITALGAGRFEKEIKRLAELRANPLAALGEGTALEENFPAQEQRAAEIYRQAALKHQEGILKDLQSTLPVLLKSMQTMGHYKKRGLEEANAQCKTLLKLVDEAIKSKDTLLPPESLKDMQEGQDKIQEKVNEADIGFQAELAQKALQQMEQQKQSSSSNEPVVNFLDRFYEVEDDYKLAISFADYYPTRLETLKTEHQRAAASQNNKVALNHFRDLSGLIRAVLKNEDEIKILQTDYAKAEKITSFKLPDLKAERKKIKDAANLDKWRDEVQSFGKLLDQLLDWNTRLDEVEKKRLAYDLEANKLTMQNILDTLKNKPWNRGKMEEEVANCEAEVERVPLNQKDATEATKLKGRTTGVQIFRKRIGDLPEEEAATVRMTLTAIDGGKPNPWHGTWGGVFGNAEGRLPGGTTYSEYYVKKAPNDSDYNGSRRIVKGANGIVYYTWTHYGDSGVPHFVCIRE